MGRRVESSPDIARAFSKALDHGGRLLTATAVASGAVEGVTIFRQYDLLGLEKPIEVDNNCVVSVKVEGNEGSINEFTNNREPSKKFIYQTNNQTVYLPPSKVDSLIDLQDFQLASKWSISVNGGRSATGSLACNTGPGNPNILHVSSNGITGTLPSPVHPPPGLSENCIATVKIEGNPISIPEFTNRLNPSKKAPYKVGEVITLPTTIPDTRVDGEPATRWVVGENERGNFTSALRCNTGPTNPNIVRFNNSEGVLLASRLKRATSALLELAYNKSRPYTKNTLTYSSLGLAGIFLLKRGLKFGRKGETIGDLMIRSHTKKHFQEEERNLSVPKDRTVQRTIISNEALAVDSQQMRDHLNPPHEQRIAPTKKTARPPLQMAKRKINPLRSLMEYWETIGGEDNTRENEDLLLDDNGNLRIPIDRIVPRTVISSEALAAVSRGEKVDNAPLSGERIDQFYLKEMLGYGSFSSVYRAYDSVFRVDRAIKILRPEMYEDARLVNQFAYEAKILAQLDHPNIIKVFGHAKDDHHYIVTELVEGKPLYALYNEKLHPNPALAVNIVSQFLHALEYAHTKGISHNDLTLHNIMLTPQGQVKLIDFGSANNIRWTQLGNRHTATAQVFTAPEVLRGEKPSIKSDIYSFGVISFQVITGRYPTSSYDENRETLESSLQSPNQDAKPSVINQLLATLEADPTRRLDNLTGLRNLI